MRILVSTSARFATRTGLAIGLQDNRAKRVAKDKLNRLIQIIFGFHE